MPLLDMLCDDDGYFRAAGWTHRGRIFSKVVSKYFLKYIELVTTLRRASLHGALEVLAFFAILATFCQFGDFGNFLAIFLAHFDPWTICDNS